MIYEDEDDVGYFSTPSHGGYPTNPRWSDYQFHPEAPSDALIVCNLLLPKDERDLIVRAAIHEHEHRPKLAALTRRRANYC